MSSTGQSPPANPPIPSTFDLFLSYNRVDSEAVRKVGEALKSRQLETFLDVENLPIGLRWMRRIEEALRGSKGVAVFLGKKGLGGFQEYEVEAAIVRQVERSQEGDGFPVIPVLLPGCDPDEVSYLLKLNTWIDLRHSLEDNAKLDELASACRTLPAAEQQARPALELCPYRELNAFREEDANFFFGRERFNYEFFDKVSKCKLTALVGASGSGKSSVIQAGLLPQLRAANPTEKEWVVVTLTPGQDPFARLAEAVFSYYEPDAVGDKRVGGIKDLTAKLRSQDTVEGRSLKDIAGEIKRLSGKEDCTTLFIVDQFEELFTLSPEEDQKPFVKLLLRDVDQAPFQVLLSFRLDFQTRVEELDTELNRRLEEGQVKLWPMRAEELRTVIAEPAARVGLRVDDVLVERLLHDVEENPDSLPLLEFALTQAWEKRENGRLTADAYELGDIAQAIAKRAEDELKDYPPGSEKEKIVRRALSRLVRVSADREKDTRARVPLTEFSEDERGVIRALAKARLLVTSRDSASGKEVAEVTHEALIRNWPRLQKWIENDREFLLWRQEFQRDLDRWEAKSQLLVGPLLKEAQRWRRERNEDVNDRERQFIRESERQGRKTLQWAAAAAALITVVSLGWWVWARTDRYQLNLILEQAPALFASVKYETVHSYLAAVVHTGQNERALEAAREIADADDRSRALAAVAQAFAQAGQTELAQQAAQQALAAAREIRSRYRSRALAALAQALAQAGQPELAQQAAQQALEAFGEISSLDERSKTLVDVVAQAFAQAGQPKQALAAAREFPDERDRSTVLVAVAQAFTKAGQPQQALEAARAIPAVRSRSPALADVAEAFAQAGQPKQALAAAREIPDERDRSTVLVAVAQAFTKAGQPQQALEAARAIPAVRSRSPALADVAEAFAQAGQTELALETAREIGITPLRSGALADVAEAFAQAGLTEQAEQAAQQALEANTEANPSTLLAVAQTFTQAGLTEQAEQAAQQALAAAREIANDDSRSNSVVSVAEAYAKLGNLYEARRLADEEGFSSEQKLSAYTEILLAYAKKQDPTLAERLEEQDER